MLQNPCKTLGFKKNMVYKIPPGGGGKPYPASGLKINSLINTNPGRTCNSRLLGLSKVQFTCNIFALKSISV